MINETLKPNDKMPSIRASENALLASKTSIETAYLQLAADGYIYAVERVGYFVTDLALKEKHLTLNNSIQNTTTSNIKYDFATIREDSSVSCLDLWRRYMKSALRQEDRLLSYASNQGELDLRNEICSYVRKTRNIICNADDIVIGAGFQSLLPILVSLLEDKKSISFPTKDFNNAAAFFKTFDINYRDKTSDIIYVIPSYMTKFGDIMPLSRRRELIEHARTENHIIIEDDYQSDFVFEGKTLPSLFTLDQGENVIYVSSFSRILLPSVRISFMILPQHLSKKYQTQKSLFNQSCSKAEQIALTQFIRDGHLLRHVRKMKRLYSDKRSLLLQHLQENLPNSKCKYLLGESGMEFCLTIKTENANEILKKIENNEILVNLYNISKNELSLLLSFSGIPSDDLILGLDTLINSLS